MHDINGICSALTTNKLRIIYDGKHIRYLTLIEWERLQGFPDNWTKGISQNKRYKVIGNTVTTTVIEYIGKEIIKFLDRDIDMEKYLENVLKNCEIIKKNLYHKLLKGKIK